MPQDPFLEKIPDRWLDRNGKYTPEAQQYLEYLGRHLHDGWQNSEQGDAFDNINDAGDDNTIAALHNINERIGSGDELTCDGTGFTCDSTKFTCDQDEA